MTTEEMNVKLQIELINSFTVNEFRDMTISACQKTLTIEELEKKLTLILTLVKANLGKLK